MNFRGTKTSLIAFQFTVICAGTAHAQDSSSPNQWNFDEYRKAYPEQVSRIRTSQSGKKELEPALDFCREGEKKARNNSKLNERLLESWRDLLGPSQRNTAPLKARVLEEKEFPRYIRKKVDTSVIREK